MLTIQLLIKHYSNSVIVGHIVHNAKNATHTEAQSFEISKLKNLLEKPAKHPEFTGICDPFEILSMTLSQFQFGSKLMYPNSDQPLLLQRSELEYSK